MACFYPLHGYRSRRETARGKRAVVFSPLEGFADRPVTVPCGQCVGCRLERSRQWAIRCVHEASLYDENCFITLTYSDEHLPSWSSLDKRAFQLFMKRLRRRFDGGRIRFFHCGEYGARFGRPHYHACLFGFDFPDKVAFTVRNGFPVWRSPILEEVWPFGRSEIGSVTFESAAYIARYIMKKILGSESVKAEAYSVVDGETGEVGRRAEEYTTMSRRPGIGKPWLEKFGCEVYPADSVVIRGRLVKPPRFYDMQFELSSPTELEEIRRVRRRARRREDETEERLAVRAQCAEALVNLKPRGLE